MVHRKKAVVITRVDAPRAIEGAPEEPTTEREPPPVPVGPCPTCATQKKTSLCRLFVVGVLWVCAYLVVIIITHHLCVTWPASTRTTPFGPTEVSRSAAEALGTLIVPVRLFVAIVDRGLLAMLQNARLFVEIINRGLLVMLQTAVWATSLLVGYPPWA